MCGNKLSKQAKSCDKCGKKVDACCPKCNAKVIEGYGFCGSCWFDLSGAGAKSEQPPPPLTEKASPPEQHPLQQAEEALAPEQAEPLHTAQPSPLEEEWKPPFRIGSIWGGSFFLWRTKMGLIMLGIVLAVAAIVGIFNAVSHGVDQLFRTNHALVGSWDWRGEQFYVFNPDGTGTRDGRSISWRVSRGELHVCRSRCRRCAQNCTGRTRRYFTLDEASLTLTHTNVPEITFNYTRTGYHTGPPEPVPVSDQIAQALVGTWDSQTGRFHYVFNADGTGVNPVSDFYWWVSDRGVLYLCTSHERCQGDCDRPSRYRLLLDGDTLRWENIQTRGIGHYARLAPLGRTEGLVGSWLVDGESLITFYADGSAIEGDDLNWWTRDGRLYLCNTPDDCRGNCPAPGFWYYALDGDNLIFSNDGGTLYLTKAAPLERNEGLVGGWYWSDTLQLTFNADGTGADHEGDLYWWTGDGMLFLCFSPDTCRGICRSPIIWEYTLDGDSLTMNRYCENAGPRTLDLTRG